LSTKNIKRLLINPAIHNDSPVNMAILAYNKKKRKVDGGKGTLEMLTEVKAPSKEDIAEAEKRNRIGKVEKGLHDLGDFSKANHDAVKWFEGKKGWTKDLWKRPNGFKYSSEVKVNKKEGE